MRPSRAWLLAASFLVFIGVCVAASAHKTLGFDELFTLYVAELPDAAAIVKAVRGGMDNHLPTSYLLCHYSMAVWGHTAFGLRLPSMIAVWIGLVALYRFASARTSPEAGLSAVLLAASSVVLWYAYEARAYGAMFGGSCVTLLAWQRCCAPGRGRAAPLLLFLSLSATLWTHYYAFLVLVPLALGEVVRARDLRKVDVPVALALLGGALDVLAIYAFARERNVGFTLNFIHPGGGPGSVVSAYGKLFEGLWLPVGAVLAVFLIRLSWSGRAAKLAPPTEAAARWELAAAVGFLVLPCVMWVLARLVVHAYHFRYGIVTVVGAALLFGRGVALLGDRAVERLAVAMLIALFPAPVFMLRAADHNVLSAHEACAAFTANLAERSSEPVVFENGAELLQVRQDAAAGVARRLYYLVDAEAELRLLHEDTFTRAIEGLARYRDVHALGLRSFVEAHRRFLFVTRFSYDITFVFQRLSEEPGVRLELVSVDGDLCAYLVTLPGGERR